MSLLAGNCGTRYGVRLRVTASTQGLVRVCTVQVEHTETWVDVARPITAQSDEQRMNDINTTVTALQGFKRRLVETNHERREGHLPQT
jgi:hypothetical protein